LAFVDDRTASQHQIVDCARPFGGVVQTEMHGVAVSRKAHAVFDLEGRLGAEVVHEVLAGAGEMINRGDPELPQLVLGSML
jgi:hypothetical protein